VLADLTDEESSGIIDLILLSQSKERITAQVDEARNEKMSPFCRFLHLFWHPLL
jgi:hypothetical protein